MIKKLSGVSIAVKDFEAAVKKYGDVLGVEPEYTEPGFFPFPGIKGAIFKIGDSRIYIVSSDQPDTSIAKFVETKGEGVFLLSLEVTDVEQDTKDLAAKGVQFVSDTPLSVPIATVNFAHPKSMHGVQVEFMQPVPGKFD